MDRYQLSALRLLGLCVLIVFCTGAGVQQWHQQVIKSRKAASATVEYTENFEGTGNPTNWSGTCDVDNTTDPDQEGSQNVACDATEIHTYDPNYNRTANYWTFWFHSDVSFENNETIFRARSAAAGTLAQAQLNTAGTWTCVSGTNSSGGSTTGYTSAPGVKLRFFYQVGTGADSVATLWKWNGSGWDEQCTVTNGTATANVDHIRLENGADGTPANVMRFDMFKSDSVIIASPD